jgi:hypothetical protein
MTPNACGKKGTEYAFSGTVTAASTSGTGIPAVGDSTSALACLSSKGNVALPKGTTLNCWC